MTLSLTHKRWNTDNIVQSQNPQALIGSLIQERKLDAVSDILDITDPSVFPDIEKAKLRIKKAIEEKQHICIFGDYDCDGVTGCAQLIRYFQRQGIGPTVRLPHRVKDGYGLNMNIVAELIERGIELLLTVDTGIASVAEIAALQDAGIDVILTDHHQPPEQLPPAFAIIHPAVANYPLPHPAGSAVAFQLVRALEGSTWHEHNIDIALAMIGTVGDLVELRGDNRKLVVHGLRALSADTRSPLRAMLKRAGIQSHTISSTDIGFRIAPRINAAGRMADPTIALQAVLGNNEMLEMLDSLNTHRQTYTQELYDQILENLHITLGDHASTPALLSALGTDYAHGVIGLIAGKLTEQFGRPSIVAAEEDGMCTASLRSTPAYNITDGLTRHKNLLERFGGHAQAAGLTCKKENWNALIEALTKDVLDHVAADELVPTIVLDAAIEVTKIDLALCDALKLLEPYGQGNSEPLFLLENAQLEDLRCVGTESQHLQAKVQGIACIGFGMGHLQSNCSEPVDMVCKVGVNEWNGRKSAQLQIVDLRNS